MGKHVNEFISALTDLISAKLSTERRRGDYDDYAGLGEWKAEEAARAVFPAAVREALEEAGDPGGGLEHPQRARGGRPAPPQGSGGREGGGAFRLRGLFEDPDGPGHGERAEALSPVNRAGAAPLQG